MTTLTDAAYKLNKWMSEPNKSSQRMYRIKQYRSGYMARLNNANKMTWKDWAIMGAMYILGAIAIATILRLVDNGIIF